MKDLLVLVGLVEFGQTVLDRSTEGVTEDQEGTQSNLTNNEQVKIGAQVEVIRFYFAPTAIPVIRTPLGRQVFHNYAFIPANPELGSVSEQEAGKKCISKMRNT